MSTIRNRPSANRPGRATALTATLALAALSGCAATGQEAAVEGAAAEVPSADEVTVTHAQGETIVPFDPETVVAFDLASLDTLSELGVEVDGLPTASLRGDLARFHTEDVVDVGTLFEPDYEAVAAAAPDLIVVGGRSAPALPELAEIAPTIDLTNDPADLRGSVVANAEALGQIFGKEAEVAELVADLDARIEAAREVTASAGTGLIVMTSGGEVTAYGPGSRFGFLHEELGITPAVQDIDEEAGHGEAVSFEFIAEADPDWLFVIDRDAAIGESGAAAEQVLDNELVAGTTAWQQDQVHYVDGLDWYVVGGGLGALSRMVDEVTGALAG